MKVILLPRALSRLDEIFDWLKTTNSESFAVKIYNSILDELEILEKQPKIASIEPLLEDLPKQFRSLVINKNLLYRRTRKYGLCGNNLGLPSKPRKFDKRIFGIVKLI